MILAGVLATAVALVATGVLIERWERRIPHKRYQRSRDAMDRAARRAATRHRR